jgi:hypothetical protein
MTKIYFQTAADRQRRITPPMWLEVDAWGAEYYLRNMRRVYKRLRKSGLKSRDARFEVYNLLHLGRRSYRAGGYGQ